MRSCDRSDSESKGLETLKFITSSLNDTAKKELKMWFVQWRLSYLEEKYAENS